MNHNLSTPLRSFLLYGYNSDRVKRWFQDKITIDGNESFKALTTQKILAELNSLVTK